MPATPTRQGARKPAARTTLSPDEVRPEPLVLVTGSEDLLAERAVTAIVTAARTADPEVRVEHLDAGTYETGSLTLVTSPSLFGGGIVVVVAGVERTGDAFVRDVTGYLRSPAPDTCLVLRHSGGQKAKGLLDAARAAGAAEVVCAPLTKDDEKTAFVTTEFRRAGRRITAPALRALVDAVGSDLRELAASCAQLIADTADAGTANVDVDVVERYFGGRVEATAFKVADAAVAGQADRALGLLRHALATGADPVPLVAALAMKVRALAKVSAAGRGRSAEIAKDLGMAPWQIDRARRELSGWSDGGLAAAVLALAEADSAVKGGGRDPVYAVEKAVLAIAHARGPGR